MTAIEKSNDGLSPLPKLLISHGLPVLSGSNPQGKPSTKTTQGVPLPPPPKKKSTKQTSPAPPPTKNKKKKTKKKQKTKQKQGPREKMKKKKKKKRELSLRILPRRNRLLTSLYGEKARKAWPTATILNEIFEFSEIYVCQKY